MSVNISSSKVITLGDSWTPSCNEEGFLKAGRSRSPEGLQYGIDNGIDITVVDSDYNTVLHQFFIIKDYVFAHNHIHALDILLKHKDIGKIINAKNNNGDTPLLLMLSNTLPFTIDHIHEVIIKKLLDAGAIADQVNSEGQNALHLIYNKVIQGWGKLFLSIIENIARSVDEKSLTVALVGSSFPKEVTSLVADYLGGTAEKRLYDLANGIFSKSLPPLALIAKSNGLLGFQNINPSQEIDLTLPRLFLAGADPTVSLTEWDEKPLSSCGNFPHGTTLIDFIQGKSTEKFDLIRKYSSHFYEAKRKVEKQRQGKHPKHSIVDLTSLRRLFD